MCGSYNISDDYRAKLASKGFLFDDTGDNISHLNKWFADLTGLYWVWKNTDDEILGINQYRRAWNNDSIRNLVFKNNTIYITPLFRFNNSTYDQFVESHTEMGLKILREAAERKVIHITPDMVDDLKRIDFLSSCYMMITTRDLFDEVCKLLFDVVLELYHGTKYALPFIQYDKVWNTDQTRMIAFLAERIMTLILMHKKYYLKTNPDIEILDWINGIDETTS
jgi:hypothetical protein